MSIQIPTTEKEIAKIKRLLKREYDILCTDRDTHVKFMLVAQQMTLTGKPGAVKAKIVAAYKP